MLWRAFGDRVLGFASQFARPKPESLGGWKAYFQKALEKTGKTTSERRKFPPADAFGCKSKKRHNLQPATHVNSILGFLDFSPCASNSLLLAATFFANCRDPDVIGCSDLKIRRVGGNVDALQSCSLPGHGAKNQEILVVEYLLEPVEIRFEAHRSLESQSKEFSAAFIGDSPHS